MYHEKYLRNSQSMRPKLLKLRTPFRQRGKIPTGFRNPTDEIRIQDSWKEKGLYIIIILFKSLFELLHGLCF
jgi:hypothetical protein